LTCPGVDLHCAAGAAPGFDFTDPERLLSAMDAADIGHAALGPIGHWAAVAHDECGEVLRGWCARWPGRFSRWVTVNPWYPDAATRLAAMITADVTGVKLNPGEQGSACCSCRSSRRCSPSPSAPGCRCTW
jgi:hypothetical protein